MARIRYQDSDGKYGELDLHKVKPGDLTKFKADFIKVGDDAEDEKKVSGGELGEVLEVYPMMPGILVECPCEMHSMGSRIMGEASLVVKPEDVDLVVDSRDPRLSSSRMAFKRSGIGYADWLPLILWALKSYEREFPGKGNMSLKSRRHVVWAIDQLSRDLESSIPAHELNWNDQDEENSKLVELLGDVKRGVERTDDEEWVRMLPQLADIMDDTSLMHEYNELMGLPATRPPETPAEQVIEAPLEQKPETLRTLRTPEPPAAPAQVEEPELEASNEFVLEEPSGEPYVADAEEMPTQVMENDVVEPLPSAPPKYDVKVFGEPGENGPHGWAEPPERTPILAGGEGRTQRVWAVPGMEVINRNGDRATISRAKGDTVEVQAPNGMEAWPASAVRLAPDWRGPVIPVAGRELANWRKRRNASTWVDVSSDPGVTRAHV